MRKLKHDPQTTPHPRTKPQVNSRQTLWEARRGIVIVVCLGVLFIWKLVAMANAPERYREDIVGAPLQAGEAAVVEKRNTLSARGTYAPGSLFSADLDLAPLRLELRVHNQTVTVGTGDTEKWAKAPVGGTVSVGYRIGKSGRIYIEDWQPLSSALSLPAQTRMTIQTR